MNSSNLCQTCGKEIPQGRRTCPHCLILTRESRHKLFVRLVRSVLIILAPYLLFWLTVSTGIEALDQDATFMVLFLSAFLGGTAVGMIETFWPIRHKMSLVPSFLIAGLCGVILGAVNLVLFGYMVLTYVLNAVGGA